MKRIAVPFIVIAFLFTSCKSEVEETIKGMWTIDTITYNGNDVKGCLNSNVIFFKEGEASTFPTITNGCEEVISPDNNSQPEKWEIIKSPNNADSIPLRLEITSKGKVINGIHRVAFHGDQSEKLLKMEFWSDSLYVLCRKGLFNYDKNLKTINRLENLKISSL
ncbi:hypothetical protein [Rufibacter quisquiliarum]|uniref:Lipocalin-like domain-containing protein n=1 Tax=Rufibacter quisquiliarum TaxID=1549639 RepID=A0A839GV83_9BACT|nr:hypothetical protein [Rufibacter quisquiliarum]MBA9078666.1 hypothetical protein [Rufibacter quisquiliarum]